MEQAIKIAIENGWDKMIGISDHIINTPKNIPWYLRNNIHGQLSVCNDPLFWQALGKGLGWGRVTQKDCCTLCGEKMPEGEEVFLYHGYSCPCPKPKLPAKREWKDEWHRFIDYLAEGKDIDSFFADLIHTK